jgi:hypothetical protein
MNDVLGALNEAIRCREEKDEDLLSETDNSPSKKSSQGHSPSKLMGKGIRCAPPNLLCTVTFPSVPAMYLRYKIDCNNIGTGTLDLR